MVKRRRPSKLQDVERRPIDKDDGTSCWQEGGHKNRENESEGKCEKIYSKFFQPTCECQNHEGKSDLKLDGVVSEMKEALNCGTAIDPMSEIRPAQAERCIDVREELIPKGKCEPLHRIGRKDTR